MEEIMDYYIMVNSVPVPVTEAVYKEYCRGERKERYFRESDIRNRTLFYDALDTDELNGSEMFGDAKAEPVDEAAEKHWLLEQMKKEVEKLSDDERELLGRIYLYGDSLRTISGEMQIPLSTLHGRHMRILDKLRKNLEI